MAISGYADGATTGKIYNGAAPTYCTSANRLLYSGVPSPPGSPTTVTTLDAERTCNGNYWMDWGGSSGATSYQVYKTESVQPGCESLLTSTMSTSMTVSSATVSTTFRVRGCNATGCGGYSPPRTISHYTGCQ
jgi:hypothetical protein